MATFVPGADLSQGFYEEVVRPVLGRTPHAAALLGTGSDVLGFDTARSTDHGWGPRMHVFVDDADVAGVASRVEAALPGDLPGLADPVRMGRRPRPAPRRRPPAGRVVAGPPRRRPPRRACERSTGSPCPSRSCWRSPPAGCSTTARASWPGPASLLAWYPDDVWLWLLACQWRRLDQEEPFVGRTAEVGDELGSRILAARLARDLMRLCLLLDRRYAPYSKWLGSAFGRPRDRGHARPVRWRRRLSATTFPEREAALVEAFQTVARRHNDAGVTRPVPPEVSQFHGRPFRVLGVRALRRRLPGTGAGSVAP